MKKLLILVPIFLSIAGFSQTPTRGALVTVDTTWKPTIKILAVNILDNLVYYWDLRSWASVASGGGGTPGGSNTQLQYNNAGAFGGISGATTNGSIVTLATPVLTGNVGISTTSPDELLQVGTVDPVISLKQTTSAQKYLMRIGTGSGLSSQVWNLYNSTASKHLITASTNRVIIGNPTSAYGASTLYVKGYGSSGSNIDAQPDSAVYDEGNIEIMASDYTLGYGIAMRQWGNVGIAGTVMGYTKKNMGILDFTNEYNIIRTNNSSPLLIGINNVEKLSVTTTSVTSLVPITLKGYTVATLPTGVVGMTAYCTDLTTPTYLAVAVGGGAIIGTVFYNGTNWISN